MKSPDAVKGENLPLEEVGQVRPEGIRDSGETEYRHISNAALNTGHVRAVDPSSVGKFLL
jgi:hypothetical protein